MLTYRGHNVESLDKSLKCKGMTTEEGYGNITLLPFVSNRYQ